MSNKTILITFFLVIALFGVVLSIPRNTSQPPSPSRDFFNRFLGPTAADYLTDAGRGDVISLAGITLIPLVFIIGLIALTDFIRNIKKVPPQRISLTGWGFILGCLSIFSLLGFSPNGWISWGDYIYYGSFGWGLVLAYLPLSGLAAAAAAIAIGITSYTRKRHKGALLVIALGVIVTIIFFTVVTTGGALLPSLPPPAPLPGR